jgi:hypothetical protein
MDVYPREKWGFCGREHIYIYMAHIVGFATSYMISAYHY